MSPEVVESRALRRVSAGGVSVAEGGYVHGGRAITGEVAAALVRLHAAGHLSIGPAGPGGHRPVHTTVAGAARLGELRRSGRHERPPAL